MTPERLTELRVWFAEGHELKSRRYGAELIDEIDRLRAALELIAQVRHVSGSAQGAFRANLKIADAALAGKGLRNVEAVEEAMR